MHRVEIPPGSLVLLYTDGLIERRGDDLFDSLERLRITVGGCSATAATCLEMLADEYETDRVPDDVAMLAMAVAGPGANGAT